MLQVGRSATTEEIRAAYRRLARLRHPDRQGGDDSAMAALNEAYRVLGDADRRSRYDASLARASSTAWSAAHPGRTYAASPASPTSPPRPTMRAADSGPARFPWKLSLVVAALGALAVFVGASLYRPAGVPPPDNLLEPGSCVALIDTDRTAAEVPCDDAARAVVRVLVGFDDPCPAGTAAYRDRQGRGTACVEPRVVE